MLQGVDQGLGSGNIGGHRNVVHIAKSEKAGLVRLAGADIGIPEPICWSPPWEPDINRTMRRPVASDTIFPVVPVAQRWWRLSTPQ